MTGKKKQKQIPRRVAARDDNITKQSARRFAPTDRPVVPPFLRHGEQGRRDDISRVFRS